MIRQKQTKELQTNEPTGQGSPKFVEPPTLPTPGQAEGDRETVEEDLRQKARSQRSAASQGGSQGGSHEARAGL
jgi:hypothetical protein